MTVFIFMYSFIYPFNLMNSQIGQLLMSKQYNDNSKCEIPQFTLFYMADFNSYKLFLLAISKLIFFYMSNFNSHKLFFPE